MPSIRIAFQEMERASTFTRNVVKGAPADAATPNDGRAMDHGVRLRIS